MMDFPLRLQHPSGQVMSLEGDKLLVSLKEPTSPTAAPVTNILGELGLVALGDAAFNPLARSDSPAGQEQINNTPTRIWTHTDDGRRVTADALAPRLELASVGDAVEWVAPVYSLQTNGRQELLSLLPDVLLIKTARSSATKDEIAETFKTYGLIEDRKQSQNLIGYTYYKVANPRDTTSIEIAARLLREQKALVNDIQFEIMPMTIPTAYIPGDPLFSEQWNLVRIGVGGPGHTAWNITRGDPSIVVAILDTGCDLTHPDLQFSGTGINLGSMSGDGGPTGNHGTACAGIVAARLDNSRGVAGIAGGCRILPIAFQTWTDLEVARGIKFATDQGARVISMSFGSDAWSRNSINEAIQYAFDRNVVMCVATHNYNRAITFPATNPLVMACGASDQEDNRKSPTSPDGETYWGSDYGPEMSVVAPGVHIPSTDRQGNDGYNIASSPEGDYTLTFNGTSAATPHVAGLAALLLSRNSGLTSVQVRVIIEQSADKVGNVSYVDTPGKPNGSWNQEMGYGRINAISALSHSLVVSAGPVASGLNPAIAVPDGSLQQVVAKLATLQQRLDTIEQHIVSGWRSDVEAPGASSKSKRTGRASS